MSTLQPPNEASAPRTGTRGPPSAPCPRLAASALGPRFPRPLLPQLGALSAEGRCPESDPGSPCWTARPTFNLLPVLRPKPRGAPRGAPRPNRCPDGGPRTPGRDWPPGDVPGRTSCPLPAPLPGDKLESTQASASVPGPHPGGQPGGQDPLTCAHSWPPASGLPPPPPPLPPLRPAAAPAWGCAGTEVDRQGWGRCRSSRLASRFGLPRPLPLAPPPSSSFSSSSSPAWQDKAPQA